MKVSTLALFAVVFASGAAFAVEGEVSTPVVEEAQAKAEGQKEEVVVSEQAPAVEGETAAEVK